MTSQVLPFITISIGGGTHLSVALDGFKIKERGQEWLNSTNASLNPKQSGLYLLLPRSSMAKVSTDSSPINRTASVSNAQICQSEPTPNDVTVAVFYYRNKSVFTLQLIHVERATLEKILIEATLPIPNPCQIML